ncbi:serine/threonine-protein kinase, partial [Ideonella azotifigens]
LAERADGLVQRQVALKLPRVTWGDTFAERLAREREILASLAHPHIARLYDAGVDAHGRPYLAMEYVQGEPIDAYCRHHALPLRERVALLLQVMAAVAHAHARLVVHRDLKPSNILVTSEGQASLLDFGIAKLLDGEQTQATALTEQSGRALTLDYASPEQIRGEPLGTASDIYSMAVVAYEVLADVRPYRLKRGSAAELEEVIAGAEVPSASSASTDPALRKQLRGDLDAILNHALKKSAAERYPTMEAFAQDLRRWLDGEPVQAQPDRIAYRAAKFVGRHRLQVAAGAAVVAALVAGTGISAWQAHEARRAAAEARTQTATAAAVKTFMERVFLANSGDQADPKRAREMTARALLDQGAARLEIDLRNAPEARLQLYATLAGLYGEMELKEQAYSLADKRLALARELHGVPSLAVAQALIARAQFFVTGDKQKEALSLLSEATASMNAVPPLDPDYASTRVELGVTLADAYQRQTPLQALPYAERAVTSATAQQFPGQRVKALRIQADVLSRLERNAEAQAALKEVASMIEGDHSLGWHDVVDVYSNLADLQSRAGQRADAEASYKRALVLWSDGAGATQDLAIIHNRLAISHYISGQYAEAVEASRTSAEWARQLPPDTPLGLFPATFLGNHGRALNAWGHSEEALSVINEGLGMIAHRQQATGQPAVEHEGPLQAFRAEALIDLGRLSEAEHAVKRCWELLGDNRTHQITFANNARRAFWVASGQANKALDDFSQSPRPSSPDPSATARWRAQQAMFEMAAGDATAAQHDAEAALAMIHEDPNRAYLRYPEGIASFALGQALLAQGDAKSATAALTHAEELYRGMYDAVLSLQLARLLSVQARALDRIQDTENAKRKEAEARAIRARHRGDVVKSPR